jgi:hypothetical protein
MENSNKLHRLQSMTAALVGVFFFNVIVGVFGLRLAIAGLAAFVLGAVVVCVVFSAQGAES